MRILLDVDGVIADLVGDLCTYLRDRQPSHFTEYNFADVLNAEETKRVHSLMRAPGFCAGLPWYDGAQQFVAALQTMGEVIAVTKPFARGPTWAFERTNWLKPYVADVVHTDRKSLVAGDILIEDSTHNAEEWLYAHPSGLAILIDRPWNYKLLFGATRLLRAHSYTECLSILRHDMALIQAAATVQHNELHENVARRNTSDSHGMGVRAYERACRARISHTRSNGRTARNRRGFRDGLRQRCSEALGASERNPMNLVRVIVPDSHGEHIDISARNAFLSDLARLAPQEIILLGDHLDCGGTFNAHQRSYTNEMTESYSDDVTAANVFLDKIQRAAPRGQIYYLEGNHEQHVERWAARNFASHKDAVMALEHFGPEKVLGLKGRAIRYYKRSKCYQGISIPGTIRRGRCYFVHGVSHSKHCAAQHLARFGACVVFGHVHRSQSVMERTVSSDGFGAWCPGTLAKLQPLYRHTEPTSWSHGYGVQFVNPSGRFLHVNVPIHAGKSLLMEVAKKVAA